jgi:putative transposase
MLARWTGCQRFIYNGKVNEDRLFAAQRRLEMASGKVEVKTPLDQAYAQFKDRELTPWLYEVPSQILRNGAVRWMSAKPDVSGCGCGCLFQSALMRGALQPVSVSAIR